MSGGSALEASQSVLKGGEPAVLAAGRGADVLARQQRALMSFTASNFLETRTTDEIFRQLTELGTDMLEVQRASVWTLSDSGSYIICADLYERGTEKHSLGNALSRADFPRYFAAVESREVVDAANAHGDPRTAEFSAIYLRPLGIGAMLDVPIVRRGATRGVMCFEHVGDSREWNAGERISAISLANIAALAEEIGERRAAHEELAQYADQFKIASSIAGVYAWLWNPQTDQTNWWSGREKLLGPEPQGGYPDLRSMIHPEDRAMFLAAGRKSLSELGEYACEFRMIRTDGEVRWMQARGRAFISPVDKLPRMMGAMVDIHARKLEEEALATAKLRAEEANRAKSEFLARISHELRTPLNGILGFAEYLKDNLPPGQNRDCADTIHSAGNHLYALVNGLLDLSRIESGKMEFNLQEVELRPLLKGLVALHAGAAAVKGLDFELEVAADVPVTITTDVTHLQEILNNLCHNAVKFTERGRLRFFVSPENGGVAFSVVDTGPGIAAADQQRIFERFVQADSFASRTHSGSGLGLALARELIQMLGGSIRLESTLGEGSTFTVWHPHCAVVAAKSP